MTPAMFALAAQLAEQGFLFWNDFQAKANAGTLTQEDLDHAATKLDVDLTQLQADINARQANQQPLI